MMGQRGCCLVGCTRCLCIFPIAMILAAAAVELILIVRRGTTPSTIASFCVWVGTIFACLATWCGWVLGEETGGGETLELHRWFGVAATGVLLGVVLCWIIQRISHSNWSFQAYRGGLWGGAVLIVVTSVYGGDMVWGQGLAFALHFKPMLRRPQPPRRCRAGERAEDGG